MFLPQAIQNLLEKNSFYLKFRYSKWIYWFWLMLRMDVKQEIKKKENFYQILFPEGCQLIFDIGANEGVMTNIFSSLSQRVIAVEPSARNLRILNAKFGNQNKVAIFEAAVSDTTGEQIWYEDKKNFAMGTLSPKWNHIKNKENNDKQTNISTVTLDNLISRFGQPDYIKIDIEGHEWQALQGLSKPVPCLSFEAILPQFLEETVQCIQRLESLYSDVEFNYLANEQFAYSQFQKAQTILDRLKDVKSTVDIFCKTSLHSF